MRRVREHLGDDVPLVVNADQQWDHLTAVRGRQPEGFHLTWIEGPLEAYGAQGHARLSAAYPRTARVERFEWLEPVFNERLEIADGRLAVLSRPGLGPSLSDQAADGGEHRADVALPPGTTRLRKHQQVCTHADLVSYVGRMSPRDPEPRPLFAPPVGKVDRVLAILIIIGIAFGLFWLVSSLASSYIGFFA